MMNLQILPIAISLLFTALIVLLTVLIYFYFKKKNGRMNYDEQLQELLNDESDEKPHVKLDWSTRWNAYWGGIFRSAGIARYGDSNRTAGRDATIVMAFLVVIISLISQNVIVGFLGTGFLAILTVTLTRTITKKKSNSINAQLPGFISALKSNIKASDTYERAMLKIVDDMPSPLYDDLFVMKNKLLASASFTESLQAIHEKTSSKDLQFLVICLIQATQSGADMEEQLTNIQHVLDERRKVKNEKNKAVQATVPAIVLSTVAIPAVFIYSYFFDGTARSYWFSDPISWGALGAVILLYGAGMFTAKKKVDAIENM